MSLHIARKAMLRKYQPAQDFLRIRDMLVETHRAFEPPVNWDIVRWNYARYCCALLTRGTDEDSRNGIRDWESRIGVWETTAGEIVGVVNPEYSCLGEAFFQRRPNWDFLLGEMLDYAEETLIDRQTHTLRCAFIADGDAPLEALLLRRGYQKAEWASYDSVMSIGELPPPCLPAGYMVRSMADDNDIELRRRVVSLGFDHPDPQEWTSAFAYAELQKAPDYRKDLDLYVVGPDGEYVSCCVVWYDERNRTGTLEPVATPPAFRRRGFGREVVMEGIRRVAALGAESVWVGSDQQFYLSIGFQKKYACYDWTKTSDRCSEES